MTERAPPDPDFEHRVRDSFARQTYMSTLGAALESVAPGVVAIRLAIRRELTQQNGFLHAGALASVADSACGYAALTLMPAGADVLSIEFKINMLAPAVGDAVIATGTVIRAGKQIMVCRGDVESVTGDKRKLVAAMQATMMVAGGGP